MDTTADPMDAPARVRETLTLQRDRLLAFVRRRAGALVDAEEVLQRATERALERSDQVRDASRVEAWVGRVVRNVLMDELRRSRMNSVDVHEMDIPAPAPDEEPCRCSLGLLRTLEPAYVDILTRVLVHGTPVTQAALEIGITPNNAMVRLHRAKRALRARLLEHCGTTSIHACQICRCMADGCCDVSTP